MTISPSTMARMAIGRAIRPAVELPRQRRRGARRPRNHGKMIDMSEVGVLEIGGTHATSALITGHEWAVRHDPHRVDLDSHADAETLLDAMASAAAGLR